MARYDAPLSPHVVTHSHACIHTYRHKVYVCMYVCMYVCTPEIVLGSWSFSNHSMRLPNFSVLAVWDVQPNLLNDPIRLAL